MTFHDIYAVADTRPRCYFSFEDEEEQYFEHGFIHLYGIPDDLSESDVENIYNGGSDKSIYIGEIIGTLIREPDLPKRWESGDTTPSKCVSCNGCYRSYGHKCVFKRG
ncbi:MAG: hypothetical protein J6O50_02340 [Ruminiclostridium sp.]|nr:hypothetical protein [Ruminiclostridium sp.]